MHHHVTDIVRSTLPTLARVGKATVVALGASLVYVMAWTVAIRSGLHPAVILAGAALSVATCTVVTALGFRLADIRRPVVGGVYVALLAVVYAAALTAMYGASTITWAVWPAIAAQLAVVYAIQQGAPVSARG